MNNRFTLVSIVAVTFAVLCAGSFRERDLPRVQAQTQGQLFQPPVAAPRGQPARAALLREPYRSVVDFGANGHDERWDSDAIQAAIDSLPNPSMPGTKEQSGGVVALPQGRYLLNKPIRIRNGITLRGEGAGTVLYTSGDHPAILLVSLYEHHHISAAVVEDLAIVTEKSAAIAPDASVGSIVQSRFENLIISAGKAALDLNPGLEKRVYTQNTVIRNIHLWTPGGPALNLWGNANHIEQINTEGGTRPGIVAEPAMVNIEGAGNDIRSCVIESNAPNPVVGFYISGHFTWSHNWGEVKPARDNIAYIFKDAEGQIDYLHEIVPIHRAKFENCENIVIRSLNLDGELATLPQNLIVDDASHIRIDRVTARMDVGALDDPRFSIGMVYNRADKSRIEFPLRERAVDLISPSGASPQRGASGRWQARWDTGQGLVRGSMRMEEELPGVSRRLRVEIADNPQQRPVKVETVLDVPDEMKARQAVATWRVDGPGQILVYLNGQQVASRAMNTKTATLLPAPLKGGEVLQFILPPEPGVYYISEVAVHPK